MMKLKAFLVLVLICMLAGAPYVLFADGAGNCGYIKELFE